LKKRRGSNSQEVLTDQGKRRTVVYRYTDHRALCQNEDLAHYR
jgi:hypothetical protein